MLAKYFKILKMKLEKTAKSLKAVVLQSSAVKTLFAIERKKQKQLISF